jgi:hypothetical protein
MSKIITIISDVVKWALVAIQGLDIVKKILEWINGFLKK